MVNANWWLDDEFPRQLRWNAYVVDEPTINATARSLDEAKSMVINGYNAAHGTSLTASDFEFTEIDRPETNETDADIVVN